MLKDTYDNWSKKDLIKELKKFKNRKKYGIVWEDKPEDVVKFCKEKLPVLKEITKNQILTDSKNPINLLIEGDNYHALSVLNFTHKGKIDLIYIDPPFNTGTNTWLYNNDYVEKDDLFRHSKWLSFMEKRLKLSKRLLKKNGSMIIAIDDYEVHQLGLLLEEIFPSYVKDLIILVHHPQGAGSDTVSRVHEYAFVLTPHDVGFAGRKSKKGESNWSLKRTGQGENNWRKNRPKQFFALHIDENERKVIGVGPEIPKDEKKYPKGNTPEGYLRIYPFDKAMKERAWRYNRSTMSNLIKEEKIIYTKKGALVVKKEGVNAVPIFSVWQGSRYNAGNHGSSLLTQIMGTANTFPYPKSLFTVKDMIDMIIGNNQNATILDFYAGSGTTAHAVLELNDEDDGQRNFIVCTNNENNICTNVCYPRIKKIIKGYSFNSEKKPGLRGNLRYYCTDFVDAAPTDKNKRKLVDRSTEMLCVKEGCFYDVSISKYYKIFKNSEEQYMGIIFDDEGIYPFKKEVSKLNVKISAYVFSLDQSVREEEFEDINHLVDLKPIPEVILNVYRRIFR
jgi:adenine-specific DNA-methyltransferase